jgi:Uri superfamily endonuclease
MVQASVLRQPPCAAVSDPRNLWQTRQPGTYLLLIRLRVPAEPEIGRLGPVRLPAGWYVYIGSALGGLGARLRRHARAEKRPHWHVDRLLTAGHIVAVVAHVGPERIECQTAILVAGWDGAQRPVPRFGASDCRCPAHLVWFASCPNLDVVGPGWQHVPIPPGPEAARAQVSRPSQGDDA